MRYKSKQVQIDAERFDEAVAETAGILPRGVHVEAADSTRDANWYYVITMHGDRATLKDGDYVIPEPDGVHFYPCDAEIFHKRWEPIE